MDRRKFLASLAAGSGVGWLASKRPLIAQQLTPVYSSTIPFVTDPNLAGLTAPDLDALFSISASYSATDQSNHFPQSVAAGDPNPNGAILWTRVDPQFQGGPLPTALGWQIASDPSFSNLVINGAAGIDSNHDDTVKLAVQHAALQPFTTYYYRFIYNSVPSRTGRFKTLPAAGAALSELRIGYVVCQDFENGFYNAYRYLAQENLDYVVHLGDYVYEAIGNSNPVRAIPPFPSGSTTVATSVDDYRYLYKTYRSDPDLQAAHEQFAFIQLWDDHEFANDSHQDFHPDNNTAPDTADTPQAALRQAANQAWSEYSVADVPFDPLQDWEHSLQVYRKISFGNLADLVVTDERLYRDGPPCGNAITFERYFSPGCPEMRDSSRTMLGLEQRDWFLNQITQSSAVWKLWANEVMLMQLKVAGIIYVDLDQWDGYQQERNHILDQVHDGGVKNFVALTGDLHTFLAGYLKRNFDNPFDFLNPRIGVELMVGSVSSANFNEDILSVIPLKNTSVPAKNFGAPPEILETIIRTSNPHIQYFNSSTHGYGVLDINPNQLTCTFKAVTSIRDKNAEPVILKTFAVPAGSVELKSL